MLDCLTADVLLILTSSTGARISALQYLGQCQRILCWFGHVCTSVFTRMGVESGCVDSYFSKTAASAVIFFYGSR